MKKRVLIASIFSGDTISSMVVKLSPTDLILVFEKNLDSMKDKDAEIKKKAINDIKQKFEKIINIDFLKVESLYNVHEVAKQTVKKIDELQDAEIILNISEGRKPISFGMSFAGYLRKGKVSSIYYLIKETDQLLRMPFLNFNVNDTQKQMLKELEKNTLDIKSFREKIDKSKSIFYQYIKELQSNGYVFLEEDMMKITDLGKIVIL
jgi:CRISPR locus-related DNA-binding protein